MLKLSVTFAWSIHWMKTVQRIGILLLLLVFLCGTTGISVFEHICTCRGKTEITLFPELFEHNSSCCCSDGKVEVVSADHAQLCGLENADHCKNIIFFIKAAISPAPVVLTEFSFTEFTGDEYPLASYIFPVAAEPADELVIQSGSSPPISGRQRIISYHQSKVPAPHHSLV
jgi:hypothetical protein